MEFNWEERYIEMVNELEDSWEHKAYMLASDACFHEWVDEMELINEERFGQHEQHDMGAQWCKTKDRLH